MLRSYLVLLRTPAALPLVAAVAGGLVETAGTSAGFLAAAALVALAAASVLSRSGRLTGTVAPEVSK